MHRSIKLFLGFLGLLALAAGGFSVYLATVDIRTYALERRGQLVEATKTETGRDSVFIQSLLTLRGSGGLAAECGMLEPIAPTRTMPLFILLGGKTTGKDAVNYVVEMRDAFIVAVDYLYVPRKTYSVVDVFRDLPAVRRALLDMVPSTMLVVDHMSRNPMVDTSRIVIVGYSFGGPFVPAAMTVDSRIDAGVMAYGGGDLPALIYHNVRRTEGAAFSRLISVLSTILLHPLEPLRYTSGVSPRPLIMINGSDDERIPRDNAETLFAGIREPKRQIWIPSSHVHPTKTDLTRTIIREMKHALKDFDMMGD